MSLTTKDYEHIGRLVIDRLQDGDWSGALLRDAGLTIGAGGDVVIGVFGPAQADFIKGLASGKAGRLLVSLFEPVAPKETS